MTVSLLPEIEDAIDSQISLIDTIIQQKPSVFVLPLTVRWEVVSKKWRFGALRRLYSFFKREYKPFLLATTRMVAPACIHAGIALWLEYFIEQLPPPWRRRKLPWRRVGRGEQRAVAEHIPQPLRRARPPVLPAHFGRLNTSVVW